MAELVYSIASPQYAEEIVELEFLCFPTMNPDQLLTVEEVFIQAEVFPEGAFMVLDGARVVGIASGIFIDYDLSDIQHTIDEILADGIRSHQPDGDWYYGIDIAVHPDYRGRRIGGQLYELRKQLVRDSHRKGIVAGGVIPGFSRYRDTMSADAYVAAVAAGELFDPTLSFQIGNGFVALGAVANYVDDPATDGWASFIVWHNPDVASEEIVDE